MILNHKLYRLTYEERKYQHVEIKISGYQQCKCINESPFVLSDVRIKTSAILPMYAKENYEQVNVIC